MADLLSIGTSGLLAYQQSLATVSHNITNVNTDNYSRQRVELSAQTPQFTGAGFEGAGVKVNGVTRLYDQFLTDQVVTNLSTLKQNEKLAQLSNELDNFLADPKASVPPVLQNFFKAMQDLSTSPSSAPDRQVLLSQAETLASVFNNSAVRLDSLRDGINIDLSATINEVNSLSQGLADINRDIILAKGLGGNALPNDLLDQRQAMISKLSELVNVTTIEQSNGALNIFIGKGQSLVVNTKAQMLGISKNEFIATQLEVAVVTGSAVTNINSQIAGGKLGGLLEFRQDLLDVTSSVLGLVALAVSEDMNAQQQLGLDLNGALGANLFKDLTNSTSLASSLNNAATDTVYQTTVTNSNLLQASEYRLDYDGTNYTLTRLSDNKAVAGPLSLGALSTAVSASEGFSIVLNSGSTVNAGDKFLISPVRRSARDIAVTIKDGNLIAAASPLRFSQASTNTGNTIIDRDKLITRTGNTLPGTPITLTFDSAGNQFTVSTGGTIAYNPATASGSALTITVAGLGNYQFTVTGTPANGDVFTLSTNTAGQGDNRNVLDMVALQQQKQVKNSGASYQEAFAGLITEVGVKTRQAEFGRDASNVLYERALSSQQALSGVNLDEEAANLIRFQQGYQAVARIIQTADELFNTLLRAVSR